MADVILNNGKGVEVKIDRKTNKYYAQYPSGQAAVAIAMVIAYLNK